MALGNKTFAANPFCPINCEIGPPWIRLVFSAHPSHVWDLGTFKPRSTLWSLCHLVPTTVNSFCIETGYIIQQRTQMAWTFACGVQHCKNQTFTWMPGPKVTQQSIALRTTLPLSACIPPISHLYSLLQVPALNPMSLLGDYCKLFVLCCLLGQDSSEEEILYLSGMYLPNQRR